MRMMAGRVIILMVAVAAALYYTVPAAAAERKVKLKVPEMQCASRGAAAVAAATSVKGVKSADDDLENTTLVVVFDDAQTSVREISKALAKDNYPVDGEPVFVK